jgi:hypothetical protein
MTKHLQNLERLHRKMKFRYGDVDILVLQLKQEISALEKMTAVEETKQPPTEAGGFELQTGSLDTRRLNDASCCGFVS